MLFWDIWIYPALCHAIFVWLLPPIHDETLNIISKILYTPEIMLRLLSNLFSNHTYTPTIRKNKKFSLPHSSNFYSLSRTLSSCHFYNHCPESRYFWLSHKYHCLLPLCVCIYKCFASWLLCQRFAAFGIAIWQIRFTCHTINSLSDLDSASRQ